MMEVREIREHRVGGKEVRLEGVAAEVLHQTVREKFGSEYRPWDIMNLGGGSWKLFIAMDEDVWALND